jgi:biotin carboxyl carrier protein
VCSSDLKQFSKSLISGHRSYQVEFEMDGRKLPRRVFAMGRSVDVQLDFPGMGKLSKDETAGLPGDGRSIRAPLPGKIITIKVQPGQTVKPGDLLCLLEAMKMENEMTSPRSAIVGEVLVKEGDSVEAGQVLVVLD